MAGAGFAQPNYFDTQLPQPITVTFTVVSYNATTIAALQTQLTDAYADLGFNYTGVPYNYQLTLVGSTHTITGSINTIYPRTPVFMIQPNQYGPTYGFYEPGDYPVPRWW